MADPKWEIKLDGNKAIEQMTQLGEKLWDKFSEPSTAVVIELLNESKYDLRHVGDYRWQGNFMEPAAEVPAGYGRVYGMESKGLDGCFGFSCYELWEGARATGAYFCLGNLVYWDGAQPKYSALISGENKYAGGKPNALQLLNDGKSASWSQAYDVAGVSMNIDVDIWRENINATAENFRVQLKPQP